MADQDAGLVSGLFGNSSGDSVETNEWCYDYDNCHFPYVSEQDLCQESIQHAQLHFVCLISTESLPNE